MDDRKHLGGIDDPIDLEIGRIEELAFLYGFLIVVALGEALVVGLVEAVDFILHIFSEVVDLEFCEPGGV